MKVAHLYFVIDRNNQKPKLMMWSIPLSYFFLYNTQVTTNTHKTISKNAVFYYLLYNSLCFNVDDESMSAFEILFQQLVLKLLSEAFVCILR